MPISGSGADSESAWDLVELFHRHTKTPVADCLKPALRQPYLDAVESPDARGTEADVVHGWLETSLAGHPDPLLPLRTTDHFVTEMAFKRGRADIVIFHTDGTASVIEAKDGTKGYNAIVSGIGQLSLYAVQLAMAKGTVRKVRRALLWSSTGSIVTDIMIEMACEQAGVISLSQPTLRDLMAVRAAALKTREQDHVST